MELLNVCIYLRKSRADRELKPGAKAKLSPDMSGFCWILPKSVAIM